MKNPFVAYLTGLIIVTVIFSVIYVSVHQNYRLGADDPQIQIAEDTAASLDRGARPQAIPAAQQLNIAKTLLPFLIIYSATGTPVFASGQLDGATPTPPEGVLKYAEEHGENRITWQPQGDVRIAAVIKPSTVGFVLAGRSLREIEKREAQFSLFVVIGWLLCVASIILSYFINHQKTKL